MSATAARKRSVRRLAELTGICVAAAIIGWFILPQFEYVRLNEWQARDAMMRLSTGGKPAGEFVFLAIDETSLRLDHLWPEDIEAAPILEVMRRAGFPWPRQVYAEALDRIFAAGARLVILDLIFDQPREGDDALRAALARYADRVVVASNYSVNVGDPAHPDDDTPTFTTPSTTLIPDPDSDPRVGYANFWPQQQDEVVRQSIYRTTLNERVNKPRLSGEREYLSLSGAALRLLGLPVPEAAPLFFRFRAWEVPTVPFSALFVPIEWQQSLRDGALLRDKIVMIGPLATRLQDFHSTAGGRLPGPLVHVNALAAAIQQAFYVPLSPRGGFATVALAAALVLLVSWRFARQPMLTLGILLAVAILYLLAAWAIAAWLDVILYLVRPVSTLALAGVSCIAWNFAQERRESGRMRGMLERYVSRNLVREVLDQRDDFLERLGGSRQPMTVFFSDVRGFTSFSEQSDPHALVEQLNEYLGEMVAIIFRHQGTVDKFMGDGIMAVWGNVVSEGPTQDGVRAVQAAMEMLERLPELNARWSARGLPPFAIGIGLHHGEAVFGNIGSAEKMEPTVIGDTVNVASRVEGLTKKYGVTLCLTQPLAELVHDRFRLRPLDLVQVVGKSRPVEIFTIIGPRDTPVPDWLKAYEAGLADYRARRFTEAAEEFKRALAGNPDDKATALHLERCAAFLETPPPPDWNGADIATSK